MAWAVNVVSNEDQLGNPEAPTVEFHYDAGSHGSHCAGIAAGHEVSGQAGLDGVAPGAWLISCKLGDNRLSGGATRTESMKKAYEYAAEFGERYGLPVVVNMSFGIDSVEEGDDAMGQWLDDLLAEHPDSTSAPAPATRGPGLSTIGMPATSAQRDLLGRLPLAGHRPRPLQRRPDPPTPSSPSPAAAARRAKPDIVAPGSALSTVPGFVDGSARFNGTTMASPQTAGAVACLLSAAQQEGLTVHWGMVKRALIAGASRVAGLSLNDQGGGLVNMAATWELLKEAGRQQVGPPAAGLPHRDRLPLPGRRPGRRGLLAHPRRRTGRAGGR